MSDAQIYDLYAQKISDITNIPYPYIIALRDNGLLNQKEARDKLIRHDSVSYTHMTLPTTP